MVMVCVDGVENGDIYTFLILLLTFHFPAHSWQEPAGRAAMPSAALAAGSA